ncbi:hypothetical protein Bpla01_10540 [Burkholderia plantarii]|nr:hypothetical protein Bpla01_10540 [Burkholderia plantarii]
MMNFPDEIRLSGRFEDDVFKSEYVDERNDSILVFSVPWRVRDEPGLVWLRHCRLRFNDPDVRNAEAILQKAVFFFWVGHRSPADLMLN